MKTRTYFFAPERAAPGMTLARAVVDHDGNTLLTAATVLTAEILERLIRRRVETICVELPDDRDESTIADELDAAKNRVDSIFRGTGGPAREALRAAILDYRLERTR